MIITTTIDFGTYVGQHILDSDTASQIISFIIGTSVVNGIGYVDGIVSNAVVEIADDELDLEQDKLVITSSVVSDSYTSSELVCQSPSDILCARVFVYPFVEKST